MATLLDAVVGAAWGPVLGVIAALAVTLVGAGAAATWTPPSPRAMPNWAMGRDSTPCGQSPRAR